LLNPLSPEFVPDDYFRQLSIAEVFPSRPDAALELDIGCGDGGFLLQIAELYPAHNFVGIERVKGRIHLIEGKIRSKNLTNVRLLRLDSSYAIGWLFPDACASRMHLLCPDPWPKKKHHKNRIIRDQEFLGGIPRLLSDGGEFLLKTDQEDYFEESLEQIDPVIGLNRIDWQDDAFPYPTTDFEAQWLSMGRSINRARWQRQPRSS